MKTKLLSLLITCLITGSIFAQTNLNAYKYVIVPDKYDFLREKDQYQLNSLTQFLFNKYGFIALKQGETYPEDLIRNRCLGLKSDLLKDSGLFKTKLTIELKDCNDEVVLTTRVGESREKDYKQAYGEALRDAFTDIIALNHEYVPSGDASVVSNATKTDASKQIEALKAEIEALKRTEPTEEVAEAKENIVNNESEKSLEEGVKEVLNSVLYAQEIENGYQLVDATPKVVYKITKTAQPNLFMVNGENAIIYKKDDSWIIEYNTSEGTTQKELNIKF